MYIYACNARKYFEKITTPNERILSHMAALLNYYSGRYNSKSATLRLTSRPLNFAKGILEIFPDVESCCYLRIEMKRNVKLLFTVVLAYMP